MAHVDTKGVDHREHRHPEVEVLYPQVFRFDQEWRRCGSILGCRFLFPYVHVEAEPAVTQFRLVEDYFIL